MTVPVSDIQIMGSVKIKVGAVGNPSPIYFTCGSQKATKTKFLFFKNVLHRELEHKVEKVKHMKLEVMRPKTKNNMNFQPE